MRLGTIAVVALIAVLALTAACAQGNLPQPVQTAVADLAQELNIEPGAVTVASFEEVTWPDASLGDPEPGRVYAQVQTPGYRVFLTADGQRYEYHTDRGTQVKLLNAPDERRPADGMTPEQEAQARLGAIERAVQHLAMRLGIEPNAVYVGAVEERTWQSAALGLELPNERYAQVQTPGYRLVLEAQGTLYDYHTDMTAQVKPAGLVEPGAAPDGGEGGGQAERPPSVDAAISDLSGRVNMEPDGITVADVEQVQWPSSAMGLPEPGMMYTQAVVPGYRITLQAKGRTFAYHAGEGTTVRYAGVVYPEDGELSVLAMSRTEPTDGNNFFHLQRIDPETQQREMVVQFVSDFVATPDGRDIVVKRRTSRSSHVLVHVAADGTTSEIAGSFDFHGMAVRPDGEMVAYWVRPSAIDRQARLVVRAEPWREGAPSQPQIPGVDPGDFTTGALAWTDDGLAFTVRTDTGAHTFYWTPGGGVSELGSFALLGWIPRTRTLLVRRARDNREILATFIPGTGETAVLANVPDLQSADAPSGEEWVVASVSDGGTPRLEQLTWGGASSKAFALTGAQDALVRVSPLGDRVVARLVDGEENRARIISLTGGMQTHTLTDAAGAVPVVD